MIIRKIPKDLIPFTLILIGTTLIVGLAWWSVWSNSIDHNAPNTDNGMVWDVIEHRELAGLELKEAYNGDANGSSSYFLATGGGSFTYSLREKDSYRIVKHTDNGLLMERIPADRTYIKIISKPEKPYMTVHRCMFITNSGEKRVMKSVDSCYTLYVYKQPFELINEK